MGIPSLFKWLRDKYPLAVRSGRGLAEAGGCDCLYLDLNGLIHIACHLTEGNQYGFDEEEMIRRFLASVEHIVAFAQPRQLLYLAVDGVAPRAKLNQQRARRYEAARHRRGILEEGSDSEEDGEDAERRMEVIKQSLDLGIFDTRPVSPSASSVTPDLLAAASSLNHVDCPREHPPGPMELAEGTNHVIPRTEGPSEDCNGDLLGWDSNCITPGTPFMVRLAEQLRCFIRTKQSQDVLWQQVVVILSDSNTCGEGEHKIINFIRAQRCQAAYQPNTTHVICGADADLVMLALALHEPHCFILRERRQTGVMGKPGALAFDLISIAALREYLRLEFQAKVRRDGKGQWEELDPERIIDDFVFLCFFVGNDFLPHLPSCFVDAFAIDNLLEIYRKMLPSLGGHLTEEGALNYRRIGAIVAEYATLEDAQFLREAQAQASAGTLPDGRPPEAWQDIYYESIGVTDDRGKNRMCREYVRGWTWMAAYYYSNAHRPDPEAPPRKPHRRETASHWTWFYPFHYSPLARDVAQFLLTANDKALADIHAYQRCSSQPFRPLTQLLAVLPPDSMCFLPREYREAAQSEESEISDFYPHHYFVDPNGRVQEWKAVVLLPFIEEKRLLEVAAELEPCLAPEDAERNELRHSSSLLVHATHPLAANHTPSQGPGFRPLLARGSHLQGLVKPVPSPDGSEGGGLGGVGDICTFSFAYLEPPIPPSAELHRVLPGTVLPASPFQSKRGRQKTSLLTGFGRFYMAVVLLVLLVVLGYEAIRFSGLTTLADSLSWMVHAASLALLHATFGLLVTPQQSFHGLDGTGEHLDRLERNRKLTFLRDSPSDAFRDWICCQCLAVNFQRNEQCHRCGQPRGPTPVSLFTHKQPPSEGSKLVIDHRKHLRRVRGWPPKHLARSHAP
eukprot:GGOE01042550.1.p1 GENE.GGOE01042550.1~~GGOE01042550.1.p1  ORF type:complete len:904 (-),score=226.32 GGOE01042550.1:209-2920(-)